MISHAFPTSEIWIDLVIYCVALHVSRVRVNINTLNKKLQTFLINHVTRTISSAKYQQESDSFINKLCSTDQKALFFLNTEE